jgi:hypothetical protein
MILSIFFFSARLSDAFDSLNRYPVFFSDGSIMEHIFQTEIGILFTLFKFVGSFPFFVYSNSVHCATLFFVDTAENRPSGLPHHLVGQPGAQQGREP